MLAIVTCISTLVAIYSIGYMRGDPGYWRFFTYISLFVFSMTMLVSASNFVLLFVFWELVGLCSYLLIGFWYEKPAAAAAGKKAFLVNRIGDAGFLLGMFLIWTTYGTLDFDRVFAAAGRLRSGGWPATAICLLLMAGACGKSAQFPLHVWLPDAMEGPTPVSALIHAATMVTAGVYMVARCSPLFAASPDAQYVVAVIGGTHGPAGRHHRHHPNRSETHPGLLDDQPPRLHVPRAGHRHAGGRHGRHVPPADPCLFQGPVVPRRRQRDARHGRSDRHPPTRRPAPPDARHALDVPVRLPGHRRRCGRSPASGARTPFCWPSSSGPATASRAKCTRCSSPRRLLGVLLIDFYMFRPYFLTFFGPERIPPEAGHHAHESPGAMTVPLMVLAFGSLIVGAYFEWTHGFANFLAATPSLACLRLPTPPTRPSGRARAHRPDEHGHHAGRHRC